MKLLLIGLMFASSSIYANTTNIIKSKTFAAYEIELPANLSDDLSTLFLTILAEKGYVDHDPIVHGDNLALVPIVTMNKKTTSCEACGKTQMNATGKDSEFKHNIIVADFKMVIANFGELKYSETYDYMTASEGYVNSNENSEKKYTTEEDGEASAINDFIGKIIVGMDSSLPNCVIKH